MPSSRGFDLWVKFSLERIGQFKKVLRQLHKELSSRENFTQRFLAQFSASLSSILNQAYFRQFFELEGPPFGSGQPVYTSVALCNYVTNGDLKSFPFSDGHIGDVTS